MSHAPSGWELVSPYAPGDFLHPNPHPVDGNPEVVETESAYYMRIAVAIEATRNGLMAATNPEDNLSEAVAAFTALAVQVKEDLDKIDSRFRVVSQATVYYAGVLRTQQGRASHAYGVAQGAQHDWDRQNGLVKYYKAMLLSPDLVPANRPDIEGRVADAEAARNYAHNNIEAQKRVVQDAIDIRMAAAIAAHDWIDRVISYAPLNDGVMDKLEDFYSHSVMDFFEAVIKLIDIIGPILDVIALVLVIAGTIGLVLFGAGAILLAVAFWLTVASAALSQLKFVMTAQLWTQGRATSGAVWAAGIDYGIAIVAVAGSAAVKGGAAATAGMAGWVLKWATSEPAALATEGSRRFVNAEQGDAGPDSSAWDKFSGGPGWGEIVVDDVFGAEIAYSDGHFDHAAFAASLEQEGVGVNMVFDRVFGEPALAAGANA